MAFKTPLEAAIAHLIAQGKIKSSADVARDLHLKSRGTVSSYVTGSTKISPNFQTMFESTYNIRLKDFEGKAGKEINNPDPMSQDYKDRYISLLEDTLKENKVMLEEVRRSLEQMPYKMVDLTTKMVEIQNELTQELRQGQQAIHKDLLSLKSALTTSGKKTSQGQKRGA
jgi:hypothetical protein